jgi:hypothetical protein
MAGARGSQGRRDMICAGRGNVEGSRRQGQEEVQDGKPTGDGLAAHAELDEEKGRCGRVDAA